MSALMAGFGVWCLLEPEPRQAYNIACGIILLLVVTIGLWLFGLHLPYRRCYYEMTDTEIRVIKAERMINTITFAEINHTESRGRALIVKGPNLTPIYLYPGDSRDLITKRVGQTTNTEQIAAADRL